jgi:hypothetical protein
MISSRRFKATATDGRTLEGYASIYGAPSGTIREIGRTFTETIQRGAFDASLAAGSDVKLYFQHDPSMPLARTQSGTLTLRSDEKGLKFSAELPDTTLGNDVRTMLQRGDLSGEMSFGFAVRADEWNKEKTFRAVTRADLYEVSIVVDAAYPQTSSSLRDAGRETNARVLTLRARSHNVTELD